MTMPGRDTRKVHSIARLRAVLLIALAAGLAVFTGVMLALVGDLSERFGPEVRADLEWRASRGARELARAVDIGLAIGNAAIVTEAFGVYARSSDVYAIVAVDAQGQVVARHGGSTSSLALFAGAPEVVTSSPDYLTSWAPATIEGIKVGKVAIVVSTSRFARAEGQLRAVSRITLLAGLGALVLGVLAIVFFTRAITARDRRLSEYANNLEHMVERRTSELDERNREMRLVLDTVAQGFVMVDVDGRMANERSAIIDQWFGEPARGMTFAAMIEPHAPEFATWFELILGTVRERCVPLDLCMAQLPTRFAVEGRTFDVDYRTIMDGERLDHILVIVSDVTAQVIRERREREQRELLGMFQRISTDRAGVDQFMGETTEQLSMLGATCDPVTERRLLHTLKGNCALFGLELYSELCHAIESELAESLEPLSAAQRRSLLEGWQTVATWVGRLCGAKRDDIVEIDVAELAEVAKRAEQGSPGPEIAALLSSWTLEPIARRFDRLAEHARGLARRLGRGDLDVKIVDGGIRVDGAQWSPFWAAAVHAIRNAIDHGIESSEERAAAGKPEHGQLTFTAVRDSGSMIVSFADDGRGIDWDAVRERARSAGLPHASHRDLVEALFHDGVTTRDVVSETSGRGVGMSALRESVRALGGSIDVVTARGEGARISCRFPEPGPVLLHPPMRKLAGKAPPENPSA
jgi:HPt (histidine-containing phosphotransfer) domain-containing protein